MCHMKSHYLSFFLALVTGGNLAISASMSRFIDSSNLSVGTRSIGLLALALRGDLR